MNPFGFYSHWFTHFPALLKHKYGLSTKSLFLWRKVFAQPPFLIPQQRPAVRIGPSNDIHFNRRLVHMRVFLWQNNPFPGDITQTKSERLNKYTQRERVKYDCEGCAAKLPKFPTLYTVKLMGKWFPAATRQCDNRENYHFTQRVTINWNLHANQNVFSIQIFNYFGM